MGYETDLAVIGKSADEQIASLLAQGAAKDVTIGQKNAEIARLTALLEASPDPTPDPPPTPGAHPWLTGLRVGIGMPAGRTNFTDAEIARFKSDGVTHFTVETNFNVFAGPMPTAKPSVMAQTAQIALMDKLIKAGIKVQFRLRFYGDANTNVAKYPPWVAAYCGDMGQLLKDRYPQDRVSAMFVNEPAGGDTQAGLLAKMRGYEKAFHAQAPDHLCFIMPLGWGFIDSFEQTPPTGFGPNTGLEVHDYDPHPYTHQGFDKQPAAGTRGISQVELDSRKARALRVKAIGVKAGMPMYLGETGAVIAAPSRQAYIVATVNAYEGICPVTLWIDDLPTGESNTRFDGLVLQNGMRVLRPDIKAGLDAWTA